MSVPFVYTSSVSLFLSMSTQISQLVCLYLTQNIDTILITTCKCFHTQKHQHLSVECILKRDWIFFFVFTTCMSLNCTYCISLFKDQYYAHDVSLWCNCTPFQIVMCSVHTLWLDTEHCMRLIVGNLFFFLLF